MKLSVDLEINNMNFNFVQVFDGKKFMDIDITETTPMETPFEDSVFAKP